MPDVQHFNKLFNNLQSYADFMNDDADWAGEYFPRGSKRVGATIVFFQDGGYISSKGVVWKEGEITNLAMTHRLGNICDPDSWDGIKEFLDEEDEKRQKPLSAPIYNGRDNRIAREKKEQSRIRELHGDGMYEYWYGSDEK